MKDLLMIMLRFLASILFADLSLTLFCLIGSKTSEKIKRFTRKFIFCDMCEYDKDGLRVMRCLAIKPLPIFIVIVLATIFNVFFSYPSVFKNKQYQSNMEREYQYRIDSLQTIISDKNLHEKIGEYHLKKNTESPTTQAVYDFAVECGAWFPEILTNQAVLETGKFKSDLYKRTNNLFGMKLAKTRKTTRNMHSTEKEYAEFYNWQLSVIDRILWDKSLFDTMPTKEEYLNKLQRIYAEDEEYIKKLTMINKQ